MAILAKLLVLGLAALSAAQAARVVCYWNGKSFWREGTAKVTVEELKDGLSYCTHLVYGFAALDDDDYHLKPVDKKLDLDKGKGQYRLLTTLKKNYPGMQILLSVGGNQDTEDVKKYLEVLEKEQYRNNFVSTATALVREFNFDGLDLAWQFPPKHEKYETTSLSSIWHKIKKTVGYGVDTKEAEHKIQFTSLVKELKASLAGKLLTLGVLPHVEQQVYYDVKTLMPYVDMINLWTVDYRTPERSPQKADYATPLHYMYPRLEFQNVEHTVNKWLQSGADPNKLNLGISTWARTWKLNEDSGLSGVPPLVADGPGDKGPYTKTEGLLAYYEVCVKLVSPTNPNAPATLLRRVEDTTNKMGSYGVRLPNKKAGEDEGLWVTFEEPTTAGQKALYAKMRGLGGVAVLDVGLDDPRGVCDGSKFPLTRAAKLNL
ncbi:chitinase-like protein EN03 isoform X2 [Cimex lectularius]|nr:chitinase-like protein EN03 isoform X2 [Cimex lectularius]